MHGNKDIVREYQDTFSLSLFSLLSPFSFSFISRILFSLKNILLSLNNDLKKAMREKNLFAFEIEIMI